METRWDEIFVGKCMICGRWDTDWRGWRNDEEDVRYFEPRSIASIASMSRCTYNSLGRNPELFEYASGDKWHSPTCVFLGSATMIICTGSARGLLCLAHGINPNAHASLCFQSDNKRPSPTSMHQQPTVYITIGRLPPSLRIPRRRRTLQAMPRVRNNCALPAHISAAIAARKRVSFKRAINIHVNIHIIRLFLKQRIAVLAPGRVCLALGLHLRKRRLYRRRGDIPERVQR